MPEMPIDPEYGRHVAPLSGEEFTNDEDEELENEDDLLDEDQTIWIRPQQFTDIEILYKYGEEKELNDQYYLEELLSYSLN